MKFKLIFFLYLLLFIVLTLFSYGFVDPNLELSKNFVYQSFQGKLANLVFQERLWVTTIFTLFVLALFSLYLLLFQLIKKGKLSEKQFFQLLAMTVLILLFSYPAFSHDLFNYLMDAKAITFYHENPYLVMPIEFLGEPMLKFMHSANTLSPYGLFWIILTLIPSFLAKKSLIISILLFKLLITGFYLGLIYLIRKILAKESPRKRLAGMVFFAFSPLVLIETLISSHNDGAMMFFALLGFSFFLQKKRVMALASLFASAGIKYVTLVLLPVFLLGSRLKKKQLILLAYWLLFFVFLLSPLKRELYPWYLIWPLSFAALITENQFIFWLTIALSFGTLCRYLPFWFTRDWGGITPMVKMWVTFTPPALVAITFFLKKTLLKKFKG